MHVRQPSQSVARTYHLGDRVPHALADHLKVVGHEVLHNRNLHLSKRHIKKTSKHVEARRRRKVTNIAQLRATTNQDNVPASAESSHCGSIPGQQHPMMLSQEIQPPADLPPGREHPPFRRAQPRWCLSASRISCLPMLSKGRSAQASSTYIDVVAHAQVRWPNPEGASGLGTRRL